MARRQEAPKRTNTCVAHICARLNQVHALYIICLCIYIYIYISYTNKYRHTHILLERLIAPGFAFIDPGVSISDMLFSTMRPKLRQT